MDFLKRIQTHSSYAKAQYSVIFAGFITGIIALVWATTVPARFSDTAVIANDAKTAPTDSLNAFIQDAKQQLGTVFVGNETPTTTAQTEDDSALSNLGIASTTATDMELTPTTTSPATETQPAVSKEPRVILIATSTSQKPE